MEINNFPIVCHAKLYGRWWQAHRQRFAGAVVKLPRAEYVKSMCGERQGKGSARGDQVWIKEVNESDPLYEMSKNHCLQHQNWGDDRLTRMSIAGTCLLAMRCSAYRRHDFYPGYYAEHGKLDIDERKRERYKMRTIEADNTEAVSSGGLGNSSAEATVMEVERSAGVIRLSVIDNCQSRRISHG